MKFLFLILVILLSVFAFGCETPKVCTKEAKQCPDGTGVGRNASLNCEFDPCPSVSDNSGYIVCPDEAIEFCISVYQPVCGADEKTYSNACEACKIVERYTDGAC